MAMSSSRTTARGAKARVQQSVNIALGNGALRARLNRALARANLELVIPTPQETPEPEFDRLAARCEAYTMTSRQRLFAVYQATRYLVDAAIPGAFVECGVWR